MEQVPGVSCEANSLTLLPGIEQVEEIEQVQRNEEPLLSNDANIEFASLTIEEMECRLKVGQPVENEFVAYGYYSVYARAKGFSIRKHNIERFADGSVRARDFVCSCEGNKDEKRSKLNTPVFSRPTLRCNCKAKLRVARQKGQYRRVSAFIQEHTHDMFAPDQTHLLRSARHVSSRMEVCLEEMIKSGISVASAYEYLQTVAHGRENIGFTRKDVYNTLSRKRNESKIEIGDASQLVQHFTEITNKEPYFYWNAERDENNRLVNLFFRDYRCSVDYEYFGDVLSIDTTYRTNKYNMICCPFVGVNHHLQNVMFGFAFMTDEKESSFEWLFRTFLESMHNKQPETIFTDQCQAMMNAVENVFTRSHHRLCHWHINQNAPSHFGSLNGDPNFKSLWYKCMTGCTEEEEFEHIWRQMVDEYDIGDKNWFNLMYKLRRKWATAFSCDKFSAGLKATSRSESTNATLKRKFGGHASSLYQCVIDFEKVQEAWCMDEREKDTLNHHGRLILGQTTWLGHAADVYTNEIFKLFQDEVAGMIDFAIIEQQEIVGTFQMHFIIKSRKGMSRTFKVQFDRCTTSVKCSCYKFENFGILCSHALKVLDRVNVDYIPERYIKRRWTKGAKNRVCDVHLRSGSGASELAFVHEFVRSSYDLAIRGQFHKDARSMLSKLLEDAKFKLDTLLENVKSNDDVDESVVDEVGCQGDASFIRDPQLVKSKGITDLRTRHWDVKRKKNKRKSESSKRTGKATRRRSKSSENGLNDLHSQNANQLTYPLQQVLLISQPSRAQLEQPYTRAFQVVPFQSSSLANQLPLSCTVPFATNNLGVGTFSDLSGSFTKAFSHTDPKLLQESSNRK